MLSILLVLVAAACDDVPTTAAAVAPPAVAAAAAGASSAPQPAVDAPTTTPRATLGSCIATCDGGKLSRTDRATCRLNCETLHGVTAQTLTGDDDPVGQATDCMRTCHVQGGDVAACTFACRDSAARLVNAPAPAVLIELEACMTDCRSERVARETDRTTCELTCAQNARVAGPAQATPRD